MQDFTGTELITLYCTLTFRISQLQEHCNELAKKLDKAEAGSDEQRNLSETYRSDVAYKVELQNLGKKIDTMLDGWQHD